MCVHVDSVLVCTIKNQSSHIETKIYKRMSKFFGRTKKLLLSKNGLCSTKSFSTCSVPGSCPADWHKYISGSYKRLESY